LHFLLFNMRLPIYKVVLRFQRSSLFGALCEMFLFSVASSLSIERSGVLMHPTTAASTAWARSQIGRDSIEISESPEYTAAAVAGDSK
jgi:hypothetical protein